MQIKLSSNDIKKILSTLDIENIVYRLEANYAYWDINIDATGSVYLNKKVEK